jgi:hypothetical protein
MHDIYNARYEEYLNTISTEEPQETVASGDEDSIEFATFVWQFLVKKFGLKKLIEQQTWQLIQGLHMRSHVSILSRNKLYDTIVRSNDNHFLLSIAS